MFEMDHVAVATQDIAGTVRYYQEQFGAQVLYADASWAFLRIGQGKLALVKPEQHPPHVALRVDAQTLEEVARKRALPIDTHRDGTRGIYLKDPSGNVVELICYPEPGGTTRGPAA